MRDQYQREIDYLRISVTDRCNFRCRYCMPAKGVEFVEHSEIMTYEEILRFLRIAAGTGIRKVKVTGGEPLVRKGVCGFIRKVRNIPGIESVTLTTNGALLEEHLPELEAAGITGINVSLDTLDPEKFHQITRCDDFGRVWSGIHAAAQTKIPVKVNCIPMKGCNEKELAKIAALAKEYPITVRFIEMMPIGMGTGYARILQDEIKELLEDRFGTMELVDEILGNGPAGYYKIADFKGRIGFISAVSHEFCESCNRIRLTADGILKPCLNFESRVNLKEEMRSGMTDEELERLLKNVIYHKPRCHAFGDETKKDIQEKRRMAGIGG